MSSLPTGVGWMLTMVSFRAGRVGEVIAEVQGAGSLLHPGGPGTHTPGGREGARKQGKNRKYLSWPIFAQLASWPVDYIMSVRVFDCVSAYVIYHTFATQNPKAAKNISYLLFFKFDTYVCPLV